MIRECRICKKPFETKRYVWRCKPCVNEAANIKRKADIEERKAAGLYRGAHGRPADLEGWDYEDRRAQWRERMYFLRDSLNERSEWQEFFRNEMDRIQKDKKLWRSLTRPTLAEDVRGMKSVKGVKGKIGRPTLVNKEYPDTRNVNIDDISNYRMD
jgi:hypothetical protein